MAGRVRFGPDTEIITHVDYSFDESRVKKFYERIRKFWPDMPDGCLQPGWTGVRPKTSTGRATETDFRIDGPEFHGVPGLVNLFGIDSPRLTASLAIAEEVLAKLEIAVT
jgi:L-2-hydroxyglutarate oxidase LhgO